MMPWPVDTILQDRYQILLCLQQRAATLTYRALDLQTQAPVILKCLNISQLQDWHSFELFESEVQVLAALSHPRIPALREHFELEQQGQRFAVLVLEEIQGQTLRARLAAGWRVNEAMARDLAVQALQILIELQNRPIPLLHCDIKPDNLMLDADNQLYLLDFGAARSYHDSRSVTVAGTFGYMPPEQALGQPAQPASDLYALGMTLVELLTHQAPQNLPRQDLHLDFAGLLNVSPAFQHWLEQMLEPEIHKRLFNAQQALNRLQSGQIPDVERARPVPGTRLQVQHQPGQLQIRIGPAPVNSLLQSPILKVLLVSLGFALGLVFLVWTLLFLTVFWIDVIRDLLGLSVGNYAPLTTASYALGTLSRLYILWRVLRQAEAPLRDQTLSLQDGQLRYQVGGWLSRRRKVFELSQVGSLGLSASGLVIEGPLKRFLPAQAPLQSWLRAYRVPAPLSSDEQNLLQSELKRYLRQNLPPEQALRLINNSF